MASSFTERIGHGGRSPRTRGWWRGRFRLGLSIWELRDTKAKAGGAGWVEAVDLGTPNYGTGRVSGVKHILKKGVQYNNE